MMRLIFLAALLFASGAQAMDGVTEQVAVSASGGRVVVLMSVTNSTRSSIWVPRALYFEQEPFSPLFELRSDGKAIDYIGKMVKRGPMAKADYIEVKGGSKRSNTVYIQGSYAFLGGTHNYQLKYGGSSYVADMNLHTVVTPIKASSATFTYTAAGK
jgi:hypothetical protein